MKKIVFAGGSPITAQRLAGMDIKIDVVAKTLARAASASLRSGQRSIHTTFGRTDIRRNATKDVFSCGALVGKLLLGIHRVPTFLHSSFVICLP